MKVAQNRQLQEMTAARLQLLQVMEVAQNRQLHEMKAAWLRHLQEMKAAWFLLLQEMTADRPPGREAWRRATWLLPPPALVSWGAGRREEAGPRRARQ